MLHFKWPEYMDTQIFFLLEMKIWQPLHYQTGVLQNNILILQSFYLSIVYFLVILLFYVFIATCFLTKAFYCICKLRTINRSKKNLYIFGICLSLSLAGSFPASSFWRDPDRFLYTYLVFIRYYLGFFF